MNDDRKQKMKDELRAKIQAGERAALSLKHGEPDALFTAREAGPATLEALRDAVALLGHPNLTSYRDENRRRYEALLTAIAKATS